METFKMVRKPIMGGGGGGGAEVGWFINGKL